MRNGAIPVNDEPDGVPSATLHGLLLRLAGSLPDELVAQSRAWLAASEPGSVARSVSFWAARNRIPLFDDEINLLAEVLDRDRGDLSNLEHLEIADSEPEPGYRFVAGPMDGQDLSWVRPVVDVVGGDLLGLWLTRRLAARGSPWPPPRWVYLLEVMPGADLVAITGRVQHVLFDTGRSVPLVETFTGDEFRRYQLRALGEAHLVWSCPVVRGPSGGITAAPLRLGLPPTTRACLFDLDGVLTRTLRGPGARTDGVVSRRTRGGWVEAFGGSVRYVRAVRAAGLRTAVISSGAHAREVLTAVGLGAQFDVRMDALVASRDGLTGKPSPDTFLAVAAELGVPPWAAAVFEDEPAGVEAGRAGGFGAVVGVDRGGRAETLRGHGADVVVEDLAELLGTGSEVGS